VSFAAITLYVASQRVVSKVRVYFVIDSVRKLLDTQFLHLSLCSLVVSKQGKLLSMF
jgi:hypothetical protein